MANITPRKNKDGEIISYQIRVFRGRDADGKRLKDYMMTWKPSPGMTKRQIEKELAKQATLFEENCRMGNVSTEKPTFSEYARYVVDLKERNGMKAKTAASYRFLLQRACEEIGPIRVTDLRADHLNRLYAKMGEPGQKRGREKAKPIKGIGPWLAENNLSQQALAERANVGHTSIGAILKGDCIYRSTAEKVAQAMGVSFHEYFKLEKGKSTDTLSPKTILLTHKAISAVLEQAVKDQIVPYNVAKRATPPKAPKHEMETLEVEDVQRILKALETEPLKWQVCIQLLIATGARRGEIMGLRWENVDWQENRLYLCENRVYTPETGAISTTLKTGESRYVSVSPSVMALLRKWRTEQATAFMKLGITQWLCDDGGGRRPHAPGRTHKLAEWILQAA